MLHSPLTKGSKMITCDLRGSNQAIPLPSVAAVSYLNTVPLVWGFLHGPQSGLIDLSFSVPSECARRLARSQSQVGILPVIEMHRQNLTAIPGTGIACRGAVRSILLISKLEPSRIRTLATDSGSRTSVQLARVILRHRYGVEPQLLEMDPQLDPMLAAADAALLIGDAALRVDPATLPYHVLDLGTEWWELTHLPMVFALWCGRQSDIAPLLDAGAEAWFRASLDFGRSQMDAIVEHESATRGFEPDLIRQYLTKFIIFDIGAQERQGLETYIQLVTELDYDLAGASPRSVSHR